MSAWRLWPHLCRYDKGGKVESIRDTIHYCALQQSPFLTGLQCRRVLYVSLLISLVHVPKTVCVQDHLQRSQKEMVEGVQAMLLTACATHESLVHTPRTHSALILRYHMFGHLPSSPCPLPKLH